MAILPIGAPPAPPAPRANRYAETPRTESSRRRAAVSAVVDSVAEQIAASPDENENAAAAARRAALLYRPTAVRPVLKMLHRPCHTWADCNTGRVVRPHTARAPAQSKAARAAARAEPSKALAARLVAAAAPLPSATEAPTGYSARRARRPSVGGRPASAPLRRDHDTRNAVAEPEREVEREARRLHDVELDCKLDFGAFLGALSVEYGGRTAR